MPIDFKKMAYAKKKLFTRNHKKMLEKGPCFSLKFHLNIQCRIMYIMYTKFKINKINVMLA